VDRAPTTGLARLDAGLRQRPWITDTALALGLAVVLAPTSVSVVVTSDWPVSQRVVVVAGVLAAHLCVALRRRHVVGAYAVCSAVMLLLVLSPDLTGSAGELSAGAVPPIVLPSGLVFPVLLYAVAAYSRQPFPTAALTVALTGAGMTTVRLWQPGEWWQRDPAGPEGWQLFVLTAMVATVVAPWALGRFRQVRADYVASLEDRARRAEAEREERARHAAAAERVRIAREMHDIVAHSLAVIVRQAEGGRYAAGKNPQLAVQALEAVVSTAREALSDVRGIVGALRGADARTTGGGVPDDVGPQPTLDDVPALVERMRSAGLSVALRTSGTPRELDRAVSLAAYRVVQEALTNVAKHAGSGAHADARVDWSGTGLEVAVTDTGGAAAPSLDGEPSGHGLLGMRERVTLAGGVLVAGRQPDAGFAVRARFPVRAAALTGSPEELP
jgi:signal transduction histidine kinase